MEKTKVKCPQCGKEVTTQGLPGHIAWAHDGKRPLGFTENPERAILSNPQTLKLALGDLCEDCQERVKDKLLENLSHVEVEPRDSSGSIGWLLVALVGLAILRSRTPGVQGDGHQAF